MSTQQQFVPRYTVWIKEVWSVPIEVDASSPEEAIRKAREGDGTYLYEDRRYSHSLDENTWTVEEIDYGPDTTNKEG